MSEDYNMLNNGTLAQLYQGAKKRIDDLELLIKEEQQLIKQVGDILETRLVKEGVRAFATEYGTVHTTTRTTARVMDPAVLQDFVVEGKHLGAINWSANATWCRQYAEETKQAVPGVELSVIRQLRITAAPKPKKD